MKMYGCFAGPQKMAILTSLLYYRGGCKAGFLCIFTQGVGWKLWANADSSRCFFKPNNIFKWQLFLHPFPCLCIPILLGQYFLGEGGGGLFTTGESGKYHYLLKTAALMVTTLSLVLCIICSYSICWLKRSLCIAHANFCKEHKI